MPARPPASEYAPFHGTYISLVPETDIVAVLLDQLAVVEQIVASITPEQELFRYAPEKWSVRQVFGHLADAERVFGCRALCLARGGKEPLPPFDENLFVETGGFETRPVAELADELLLLRHANLSMLQPLDDEAWTRASLVSGKNVSTRAVAWIMAGHLRHHIALLEGRYRISLGS